MCLAISESEEKGGWNSLTVGGMIDRCQSRTENCVLRQSKVCRRKKIQTEL
jgi:hypothetical protein